MHQGEEGWGNLTLSVGKNGPINITNKHTFVPIHTHLHSF